MQTAAATTIVRPAARSGASSGNEEEVEGMKLSRRTNTIILWVISIGLIVGMVITFTPTIGGFGGLSSNEAQPAIVVNGESITELEVARARQNPLFNSVQEGQVGEDLELLLVSQLIRQEVFDQAAAKTRVSDREVREEVQAFRVAQGVDGRRNDQAYLQLIGQSGFDDQSFRAYIREQIRRTKYQESLTDSVEVSDAEVEAYYLANADQYRDEDRIRARVIVVDDAELAGELSRRARDGEDFSVLAREFSLERADRAGALGAPQGSTEPQPVGRAALPQAVAAVAFNLRGPGITEPIQSGGRSYLVRVEEYIPVRTRPLSEVEDEVRTDALAAKESGIVQQHIEERLAQAQIEVPESGLIEYENYPVARVGDEEIMASELALATYTNQQIQQSLSPELAPLIVEFFKPTVLDSMINRKLAFVGASRLDADFVGTEAEVAQQALAYVSRDAAVDEEAVQDYYEANTRRFTLPAEARVTRVEFDSQESAEAFRTELLEGGEPEAVADELGGTIDDLGLIVEGQLEEALDRALFGTDAFDDLPGADLEVSDVLVLRDPVEEPDQAEADALQEGAGAEGDQDSEGGETAPSQSPEAPGDGDEQAEEPVMERFVVLVANRTAERLQPLEEVRAQVEEVVLQAERDELQRAWLAELRAEIEVQNLLAQAAEDAQPAGAEGEAAEPDTDSDALQEAEPDADPGTELETETDTEDTAP